MNNEKDIEALFNNANGSGINGTNVANKVLGGMSAGYNTLQTENDKNKEDTDPGTNGIGDSVKQSVNTLKQAKQVGTDAKNAIGKINENANNAKIVADTVKKGASKAVKESAKLSAETAAGVATAGVATAVSKTKDAIKKAAKQMAEKEEPKKTGGFGKVLACLTAGFLLFGVMASLSPLAVFGAVADIIGGLPEYISEVTGEAADELWAKSDDGTDFWGKVQDVGEKIEAGVLDVISDVSQKISDLQGKFCDWISKTSDKISKIGFTAEELKLHSETYSDSVDYKSTINNIYGTVDFFSQKALSNRRSELLARTSDGGNLSSVTVGEHTYTIDPTLTLEQFDAQGNPFTGKNNVAVVSAYAVYDSDYATTSLSKLEDILSDNWETFLQYATISTDETGGINNRIEWDPVTVPDYEKKTITLSKKDYQAYLKALGDGYPVGAKQINDAVKDTCEKAEEKWDWFAGLGFSNMPTLDELHTKRDEMNSQLNEWENTTCDTYGTTPSSWYATHGYFDGKYDTSHYYLPSCIGSGITLNDILTQDAWKDARMTLYGKTKIGDEGYSCNGHIFTAQDYKALGSYLGLRKKCKDSKYNDRGQRKDKFIKKDVDISSCKAAKNQKDEKKEKKQMQEDYDEVLATITSYEESDFEGGWSFNTLSDNISAAENGQATYGMIATSYLTKKKVKVLVPKTDENGNAITHVVDASYAPYSDSELAGITYETKQDMIDQKMADETAALSEALQNGETSFEGAKGSIEWNAFDLPDSESWSSGSKVYPYNCSKKMVYPTENARFYLRVVLMPYQSTDVFDMFDLDPDADYENSTSSKEYTYNTDTGQVEETGGSVEISDDSWTDSDGNVHTTHITNEQMYNNYYKTISSQMDGANTLDVGSSTSAMRSLSDEQINSYLSLAESQGASKNRLQFLKNAMSIAGMVPYASDGYGDPETTGWNTKWGTQTGSNTYSLYGLDCSGFIDWTVMTTFNTTDYRTKLGSTYIMASELVQTSEANLKPGDIGVIVSNGRHHCGIFIGHDTDGTQIWIHQPGPTSADYGPVIATRSDEFNMYCVNPVATIEGDDAWTDGIPTYSIATAMGGNGDTYYYMYNEAYHEDGACWEAIFEAMCNHCAGGNSIPCNEASLQDDLLNPSSHYLWDGGVTEYERILGYVLDPTNAANIGLNVGDPLPDYNNRITITYKKRKVEVFKWGNLVTPTEDQVVTMNNIIAGQRNYIMDNNVMYWRGGISSLSGYTQMYHYGGTYFYKKN